MGSLSKKQPTEIVPKVGTNSVQKSPPKEQECAGWCGEVFPVNQMKDYRKKLYCQNCYSLKMDEVEKAKNKPAGLTQDQIVRTVSDTISPLQELQQKFEQRLGKVETVQLQLRDLVVSAKTIMGHFVVLDRFSKGNQNKRQGDDMRAWLAQAEKVLEGK